MPNTVHDRFKTMTTKDCIYSPSKVKFTLQQATKDLEVE
jgi:hypothetical protein